MNENTPNFGDHDFPNPGYLIVCSGYQKLEVKEGSFQIHDELESSTT